MKTDSSCIRQIIVLLAIVFLTGVELAGAAQSRARIHGDLQDLQRFSLDGNVRPSIMQGTDKGPVSDGLRLSGMGIYFSMTPTQNADLMQLLRLQQTRHSAQFHQWLTPEQYADRFGMNQNDIQKVRVWLENQGFRNIRSARGRNWLTFDGTAGQARAAFHTAIHRFLVNGQGHYANVGAPELPRGLSGMVLGVAGLHDFHPKAHPAYTLYGSYHYVAPDDFATIYDLKALYGSGIDGTGVTIAIPGETDIDLANIAAFRAAAGLPVSAPDVVLDSDSTDPGTVSGEVREADLDIEWSGAVAKGAQVIYYNSKDAFDSAAYAVNDNKASVMSISYGECETDAGTAYVKYFNSIMQQANAQGMTVLASSGDDGAAGCDRNTDANPLPVATHGRNVGIPSSSPYVTAVGGTQFNGGAAYWNSSNNSMGGSALSYIPEVAWNDSASYGSIVASGGGASLGAKPVWQVGTGVPADGFRDVPDVAMVASAVYEEGAYLTCDGGLCVNGFQDANSYLHPIGGTSASSPAFAGIVALLVQKYGRQGNINPGLYQLASLSTGAFHDITAGDNIVACGGGTPDCSSTVAGTNGTFGYSAGVGYDQVTGLGSVDAFKLVSGWNPDLTSTLTPTSLSVPRGTAGTVSVAVTESDFVGPIHFTCSVATSLTNTTCSIPATVSGAGSSTLTITAAATAASPWWRRVPAVPGIWMIYLLAALVLATAAHAMPRRKQTPVWLAAIVVVLVAGMSGCGGGGSSSTETTAAVITPETGVVTVVATSGALTSTSTLSVTVQ